MTIPKCKCNMKAGPRLHERGCPRLISIIRKYRPNDKISLERAKG